MLLAQLRNVAPGSIFIDDHIPTIQEAQNQLQPNHPITPILMRREWSLDGMNAQEIFTLAEQIVSNI